MKRRAQLNRNYIGKPSSKWKDFWEHPFVRFCTVLIGLAAVAALVIFVLIPLFSGDVSRPLTPNSFQEPAGGEGVTAQQDDLSNLQTEVVMDYNSVNDPYMCGEEIVFSSASMKNGVAVYDKLVIYNAEEKKTQVIGVQLKYENIVAPKLSEEYIVYLDSSSSGGGRICAYDRKKQSMFVVKEYAYALPQISMWDNQIAFLQQAGSEVDRLYLYDLETRESVAAKILEKAPEVSGAVHLADGELTYSVSYMENDVLRSRIAVLDLENGSEQDYQWGRYAYSPKKTGNYIAYLSSATGAPQDLYISEEGADPVLLEKEILNYEMGDGFLAYTKGENVYAYVFENKRTYRLNSQVSRGLLASVNGRRVVWYDVTGGKEDVEVLKYAEMEWN